jgi:hypothetical protein
MHRRRLSSLPPFSGAPPGPFYLRRAPRWVTWLASLKFAARNDRRTEGVHTPRAAQRIPTPGVWSVAWIAVEAIVDGLPGAIAFREVPPGAPVWRIQRIPVDQIAMGLPEISLAPVVCGVGQGMLEPFPLTIAEFIATTHGSRSIGNRPSREMGLPPL